MTRILAVSSGKGGVGKTHLSVNLALYCARQGLRTCLFDADLGLANVNLLLKLHPQRSLGDVIAGTCQLRDIVLRGDYPMDIIPGSSGVAEMADLSRAALGRLGEEFQGLERYDLVIFDTSSGVGRTVLGFVGAAPETLLVITPEPTSLTDAYALVKLLRRQGYAGLLRVVVNQARSPAQAQRTYEKFRDVVRVYQGVELPLLAWLPFDTQVAQAIRQQTPLLQAAPDSAMGSALRRLGERWLQVADEQVTLAQRKSDAQSDSAGLSAFWGRLTGLHSGGASARSTAVPQSTSPPASVESGSQAEICARLTRLETGLETLVRELRGTGTGVEAGRRTAPCAPTPIQAAAESRPKQTVARAPSRSNPPTAAPRERPVGRRAGETAGVARFVRNARRATPIDSLQLRRVVGRMLVKAGAEAKRATTAVKLDVEPVQIQPDNAFSLRPGRYTQVSIACAEMESADAVIEEIFANCALTGCKVRQLGSNLRYWLTTGRDGCILLDGDAQQANCVRVLMAAGGSLPVEDSPDPQAAQRADPVPRLRAVARLQRVTPALLLEKYPHQRIDGGRVDGEPISIYRLLRHGRGPLVCAFHGDGAGDDSTGPMRELNP